MLWLFVFTSARRSGLVNKIFLGPHLILFTVLFAGCATFVEVKYQVPAPIMIKSGQKLALKMDSPSKSVGQKKFLNLVKAEFSKYKWWHLHSKKNSVYELFMRDFNVSKGSVSSKIEKNRRQATVSVEGRLLVGLKRKNKVVSEILLVEHSGYASSEVDVPQRKHGRKSLRPLIEGLLGVNEFQNRIDQQNQELTERAQENTLKLLAKKVVEMVTPRYESMIVRLEEGEKDIEPAIKFAKQRKFDLALEFLKGMSPNRTDVLFNRAVFLEAQGSPSEACDLYSKAYDLAKVARYKQMHIGCKERARQKMLVLKNKIKN